MKKKTGFIVVTLIVLAAIGGQISGNQPQRDAVAAAEKQYGVTLESRMVSVGDVSLHVVMAGPADGNPVILLHGYPEFWYAWRGPMTVLARAGFRVIVPDQRGYNKSDKPSDVDAYNLDKLAGDVVGLADALGYQKVSLAGHDFGGQVSWWTVLLHPDRIAKFAIINKPHPYASKGYIAEEESISWYRTFLKIPGLPGYVGRLGNWGLLVKNLRGTSMPNTFSDADMDQYRAAWDNDGAIHSMGAWYRANSDFDMNVGEARVRVPTLSIIAPDDAFSPISLARHSAKFLENGQVKELSEGTHWIIQEQPELIGNILVQFFGPQSP
ncbi:alpha/beta fold hydrolase [Kordiimonas aquimaris]|uniref:alpha/beta fold hydrolase n=1 Tax=Kordiimonas aquimaris TaxID=707591 RepID=UPI0021D033A8|nr:alpha/beta hydrolase [Kordiimonas aquimaris]